MRTVKSIVAMLAKEEHVTIVKNLTIIDAFIGKMGTNDYVPIYLTLDKPIPSTVKVTKAVIDDAADKAVNLKSAADAMPNSTADEKAAKKAALDAANKAKAYADSLELDKFVEGTNNFVVLSNFAFIGMLRQIPELKFLVDIVQADVMVLPRLLNQATINIICERVKKDEEYSDPFSSTDVTTTVPNDSVYHSGYNLGLSAYGMEATNDFKAIINDITKARLMAKLNERLTAKTTTNAKNIDDDED